MKRESRSFRKRLGRKLLAFALMLVGLIFLVDIRVRPIIEKTSAYQSKIYATRIINDAVYEEIGSEQFEYAQLVNVVYDENKQVSSIESNMVNINRLKSLITQNVNEAIKDLGKQELSISLGTISGLHIFYGKGPEIPIQVVPAGYVETALVSVFSEAGINQTLHRIILEVNTDISAIIPGYTTSVKVSGKFVVSETVIVGEVPDAFTHVITGDADLLDYINDYDAKVN